MNREKFTKEIKSGRPMNCVLVNASIFIGQLGMSWSSGMAVAVKIVTNLWSFLTDFQWCLQSNKLNYSLLLFIGSCPEFDNCSCLPFFFGTIFKCTCTCSSFELHPHVLHTLPSSLRVGLWSLLSLLSGINI